MSYQLLLLSLCSCSIADAMIIKTKSLNNAISNQSMPLTHPETVESRCKKLMESPNLYIPTEIDKCIEEMRKLSHLIETTIKIGGKHSNQSGITSFFDALEGSKNKVSALEIRSFRESFEQLVHTELKQINKQRKSSTEQKSDSSHSNASRSTLPAADNPNRSVQPPALPPRPAKSAVLNKRATLAAVSKKSFFDRTLTASATQTAPQMLGKEGNSTSNPRNQISTISEAQTQNREFTAHPQTPAVNLSPQTTSSAAMAEQASSGFASVIHPQNGTAFGAGADQQSSYLRSGETTVVTRTNSEPNSTYMTSTELENALQVEMSPSGSQTNAASVSGSNYLSGGNYSGNTSMSAATASEALPEGSTFSYTVYPQQNQPFGGTATFQSSAYFSGSTHAPSPNNGLPNSVYISTPGLNSSLAAGSTTVITQTVPSHIDPYSGPNSAYITSPGAAYAAQHGATFITQQIDTDASGLVPNSAYYISPGKAAIYPQTELRPDANAQTQAILPGTTPVIIFPGPRQPQSEKINQQDQPITPSFQSGNTSSPPSQTPAVTSELLIDPSKVNDNASVFGLSQETSGKDLSDYGRQESYYPASSLQEGVSVITFPQSSNDSVTTDNNPTIDYQASEGVTVITFPQHNTSDNSSSVPYQAPEDPNVPDLHNQSSIEPSREYNNGDTSSSRDLSSYGREDFGDTIPQVNTNPYDVKEMSPDNYQQASNQNSYSDESAQSGTSYSSLSQNSTSTLNSNQSYQYGAQNPYTIAAQNSVMGGSYYDSLSSYGNGTMFESTLIDDPYGMQDSSYDQQNANSGTSDQQQYYTPEANPPEPVYLPETYVFEPDYGYYGADHSNDMRE